MSRNASDPHQDLVDIRSIVVELQVVADRLLARTDLLLEQTKLGDSEPA